MIDKTKDIYGHWTVLDRIGEKWLCRCVCGTIRRVVRFDLWRGASTNCGCIRSVAFHKAAADANRKHGMERSPEYRIWTDMKRRCHQPHRPDYSRYGGRGIYVCDEWRNNFMAFYQAMGPRPDGHTLDRKNNDGPYSTENCQWAPKKAQDRNRRTNRIIEIDGRSMTIVEACERYGIKKATALNRLTLGWSVEDTFKRPLTYRG